jgi:hypothetical protein
MGAELAVELLVAALAGQMQVDVAQRGREGVGIADGVGGAVRVGDVELVAQRQLAAGHLALEDARGMDTAQLDGRGPGSSSRRATTFSAAGRYVRHDHLAVGAGVGAEHAVGVAEAQRDQVVDVLGDGAHAGSSSSSRRIPATGMCTQSGRLSSS